MTVTLVKGCRSRRNSVVQDENVQVLSAGWGCSFRPWGSDFRQYLRLRSVAQDEEDETDSVEEFLNVGILIDGFSTSESEMSRVDSTVRMR